LGDSPSPAIEQGTDGGAFPTYATPNNGMTPTSTLLGPFPLTVTDAVIDYPGEKVTITCVLDAATGNGTTWTEIGIFGVGDILLTRENIADPVLKTATKKHTYEIVMTI